MAVNGYADASDRWLRRRLVPVRSRIIATEPLSPNLMGALMPRRMMCSETRKLHYYYRPSPDGRRILFGGRDGTIAGDPDWPTENLRQALVDIFPELANTAITHSWFGHVAMNRDMIPRIFTRAGVRYAAGYCGSGVVWARWAGDKAARQILGDSSCRVGAGVSPSGRRAAVRRQGVVHAGGVRMAQLAGQDGVAPEPSRPAMRVDITTAPQLFPFVPMATREPSCAPYCAPLMMRLDGQG